MGVTATQDSASEWRELGAQVTFYQVEKETLAFQVQMMLQRFYKLDTNRDNLKLCVQAAVQQREQVEPSEEIGSSAEFVGD